MKQHGGNHYEKHGQMQPWDVMEEYLSEEEFVGFLRGSAICYLLRNGSNGDGQVSDISKARHYLEKLLSCLEATEAGRQRIRSLKQRAEDSANPDLNQPA